jgi:hypothetical protein
VLALTRRRLSDCFGALASWLSSVSDLGVPFTGPAVEVIEVPRRELVGCPPSGRVSGVWLLVAAAAPAPISSKLAAAVASCNFRLVISFYIY